MAIRSEMMMLFFLLFNLFVHTTWARSILNEIDNSIDVIEPTSISRTTFGHDWIKFTKPPPEKIVQELGSPVEISCEVMGSQVPTIHWVVGQLPLSEVGQLMII